MRRVLLSSIIVVIAIVFLGRLSYLQIFSFSPDQVLEDIAIKRVYEYPERGYIYDRNGELLVANQPAYDVMVIPREVQKLDTLEFCKLLNIEKSEFLDKLNKAKRYSTHLPYVFVSQLSKQDYARLQEKMRKYDGFHIQKRSLREYETNSSASTLGYISEVTTTDLQNNPYYVQGELKGKTGIERQYEDLLRGTKGVKYIQKDRFNRDIGSYKDGALDTLPKQGKEIHITIDKTLQEYGERLMHGKHGGIVAIEPSSGEILSLISGPTYKPELLVGRERSANYSKLHYDSIARPTWNRALLAHPPPGSPFKVLNALVGLQENVITPETKVRCYNGFYYGRKNRKQKCHCGGGLRNLNTGISLSCNAYFSTTFKGLFEKYPNSKISMDYWSKHIKSFGLGGFLGTDLPTGAPGRIPDRKYFDKQYYNKDTKKSNWYWSYFVSMAIGQGEIATTPIQLANMTAAIANRGFYYTPHVLKKVDGKKINNPKYTQRKYTTIDKKHFEPVIEGMANVYKYGTAKTLRIPEVSIAGKTGTVEIFTKIDGERKQLTDHSIFIAFAPAENPKIALAVYIEHGYYGNRYAGHIASLMIEKYLKGKITRKDLEKKMLEKTLEHEYAKPYSGEPFKINERVW